MRLKHGLDRLRFITQAGALLVGALVLVGLAWLAFDAARADGLVIRPFSVPPALAQRGVTGEAVAAEIADHMGEMAQTARSSEAQRRVAAARSEISIEIPETGISVSQLEQWLTEKLGHQRRVTGELMSAPDGTLVLNARDDDTPLAEQRGGEADLSGLLQKTAEDLYSREQPASYQAYLNRAGRFEDLRKWLTARTTSTDRQVRALAYMGLASANLTSDLMESRGLQEKAIATDPKASPRGLFNLAGSEFSLGHTERGMQLIAQDIAQLSDSANFPTLAPDVRKQFLRDDRAMNAARRGNNLAVLAMHREAAVNAQLGFAIGQSFDLNISQDLAALHDVAGARRALAAFDPENTQQKDRTWGTVITIDSQAEDWSGAWAAWQESIKPWQTRTDKGAYNYPPRANGAFILIKLGRLDEAQALLDQTPLDCVPCVTTRGQLATARGQTAIADHWFSEATRIGPSLPVTWYNHGYALLERKDYVGAIPQFREASRRGPKWADPLEAWGEALLAQGQTHAAIDKFKAAEKLAPRWGRDYLYWGEALAKQGKTDQARAQFAAAAGMDLTPTERAELARARGHG